MEFSLSHNHISWCTCWKKSKAVPALLQGYPFLFWSPSLSLLPFSRMPLPQLLLFVLHQWPLPSWVTPITVHVLCCLRLRRPFPVSQSPVALPHCPCPLGKHFARLICACSPLNCYFLSISHRAYCDSTKITQIQWTVVLCHRIDFSATFSTVDP